jgi:CrcB protein
VEERKRPKPDSAASGAHLRGPHDRVPLPVDPDVDIGPEAPPGASAASGARRRREALIVGALGLGGVLGALSRYAITLGLPNRADQFPWATLLINLTGSAVLGFVLVLIIEQFPRGRLARPVIGTGFLGAYTTFSTFMVDAVQLIRVGRAGLAVVYVLASLVGGLGAAWLGMTGARATLRAEYWLREQP